MISIHNVPGAFSSGTPKGADFQTVLEAFLQIEDAELYVVKPESGRWESAGAILGVRSSLAWTTWDAQYLGVPQRRLRLFLIADFAGYSPIKILFKQDGMLGDSAPGE